MQGRVTVAGAGSWGTTLARMLAQNGWEVALHCVPESIANGIFRERRNPLYFPEVELPSAIQATGDLAQALHGSDTVYLVIPARYLREFFSSHESGWRAWAAGEGRVLCNCTKGLLLSPTQRTDDYLAALLPQAALAHLAGPNLAAEIMAGQPAAAVAAGPEPAAKRVQAQLMCATYRVYTGDDLVGVEVAGFYKNIIAIAAGALSGLGLGDNTKSVLITRGLAEMGRLVDYFGGSARTLSGLAGMGDLIVTCSSALSRNFQVGMRRAAGQPLEQIIAEMTQIAEGIQASAAVHHWPAEHGLTGWPELPIAQQVYAFLHEGADPAAAIRALMSRPPKAELG
jgi:glycerol-3-phosphate dehydrogenase (NAD(P)+)